MREIVLDTETTGLDPYQGHRLIEVGCIELVNRFPTGQTFHRYLNPQRDVPAEAFAVHGLSLEFLKDKSLFADIAAELMDFIGDAPLVAHNASFDLGFLNAELERVSLPAIARERLVDTLLLARRKYPGGSNRLDDLCQRFGIDNSRRTKHGALLDAELLAEVYLELIGARQAQLGLVSATLAPAAATLSSPNPARAPVRAAAATVRRRADRPPRPGRHPRSKGDLERIRARSREGGFGVTEPGCRRCGSVRHQHRQGGVPEDVTGGAAEDELAQPALGVGALDEQVAIQRLRRGQDRFAGGAARDIDRQQRRGDAVALQVLNRLLGRWPGDFVAALHRQDGDPLGLLEQRHRQRSGARLLGAAIPCDQDIGAELARRHRRSQQHRPAALEQAGLERPDVQSDRLRLGPAHDDDVEHPAVAADEAFTFGRIIEPSV